MIVLSIVALLAVASYPSIARIREVLLVKGAAEQTAAAIRLARQFAITQGSNYCVEFQADPARPNQYQYRIRPADTGGNCNGAAVPGYDWTNLSSRPDDLPAVRTTAPTLAFDPIGNRIQPVTGSPEPKTFIVDTVPTSCVSTVSVTMYGGIRVAAC
jgi:Tfp pilus assembly protein FimT